VPRWQN
jgi:hypothetical protein